MYLSISVEGYHTRTTHRNRAVYLLPLRPLSFYCVTHFRDTHTTYTGRYTSQSCLGMYTLINRKQLFLCYFYEEIVATTLQWLAQLHQNSGNSGKSGKFSGKTCRTEFPGISGNFFRGFPGIPEIPGNFSGNLGGFSRTRAAEQGTRC